MPNKSLFQYVESRSTPLHKLPDLSGHVQHDGHHRRIIVAVDDEAHVDEPLAEVVTIPSELPYAAHTLRRRLAAAAAHDDAERGERLLRDRRRHGRGVAVGVRVAADVGDEALGAGDVAAAGAEALGEGAHEDVDVARLRAPVVGDAAAAGAERAYAVRLVQVQVALVLLLDGDDLGQVDDGALHAVDACVEK